jgi:KipI family sensor histidine kinase inhibitor
VPAAAPEAPTITALGERAFLLQWPERIDAAVNAAVQAAASVLRAAAPAWIEDIVPAYASLAVVFDAEACAAARIDPSAAADWLQAQLQSVAADAAIAGRQVEIPVSYGGDDGPDLDFVAAHLGLTPAEVITRHTAAEYRVAMLGFAPGFPYLLGLDPALAVARRATPRTSVPAGSVGIGGAQTGIYPQASPGGWQLIGRTALRLFDPQRAAPSLLAPGDRVRFVSVATADTR